MNSRLLIHGRLGTGHFVGDWDAKDPVIHVKKPFYRRVWFLRLLFISMCAMGLPLVAGLWRLNEWHKERAADFIRQQQHVAAFAATDDFKAFARAADAQVLATLNYIVARPERTRTLLPNVASWENAHHALPWTLHLSALPVLSPPERILAASRDASTLLAARDFEFDDARRFEARRLFVHLLLPYLFHFVTHQPEYDFSTVATDRRLQEQLLVAYANHFPAPASTSEVERLFVLYAAIGPDMWRTIEQLKAQPPR